MKPESTPPKKNRCTSRAARTAALTAALFAIAMATRGIALSFPNRYGLHAALCAPLFALAFGVHLRRYRHPSSIPASIAIMTCALAVMRPIEMGMPFACTTVLAALGCLATNARQGCAASIILPSSCAFLYPLTMLAGVIGARCSLSSLANGMQLLAFALDALLCLLVATATAKSAKP